MIQASIELVVLMRDVISLPLLSLYSARATLFFFEIMQTDKSTPSFSFESSLKRAHFKALFSKNAQTSRVKAVPI